MDSFDKDRSYHYPPDLFQLLVDAIPRLFKSKRDVFTFFRGAGVASNMIRPLEAKLSEDRDALTKFDIVRTILAKLNEAGDAGLQQRREILRRVTGLEDYSTCWPDQRLEAQGLVSRIRDVVNVKDSFTRLNLERDSAMQEHREAKRKEVAELQRDREQLASIKQDFYRLFAMNDAQARGCLLENVLNRLFEVSRILVRESFSRVPEPGQGTIEQIDGVIELDGHVYLVEMKWLKEPVGVGDVSGHLVRVFNRSASRGIFISYSDYTVPAIAQCKESLSQVVIVLCTLQEFVLLLDKEDSLEEFLRAKIHASIVDKQPLFRSHDIS